MTTVAFKTKKSKVEYNIETGLGKVVSRKGRVSNFSISNLHAASIFALDALTFRGKPSKEVVHETKKNVFTWDRWGGVVRVNKVTGAKSYLDANNLYTRDILRAILRAKVA